MRTTYSKRYPWGAALQGWGLLLAMFLLTLAIGGLLWGSWGILFSVGFILYSLFNSPTIAGRRFMAGNRARLISVYEAPELWRLFQALLQRAGVPELVELYYLPTSVPNAFAVGHGKHAAIGITDGLLRMMTSRELAGILAHEITHVQNEDTRWMGWAQSIGRVNVVFSRIGLLLLLFALPTLVWTGQGLRMFLASGLLLAAPLMVYLLQLALSRSREFAADEGAARITGDPEGLAIALEKLEQFLRLSRGWRNPAAGSVGSEPTWIRTHPPTAERIKRLQELPIQPAIQTAIDPRGSRGPGAMYSLSDPASASLRRRPRWLEWLGGR